MSVGRVAALMVCVFAALVWCSPASAQPLAAEIVLLRADRTEDGLIVSSNLKLALPSVIEEALTKGIALYFVTEIDVTRDRWYWTDQRVVSVSRTWRVAYQPLSRRWRLTVSSGEAALTQNFESLPETLATMARIGRWRVAEPQALDPDQRYMLNFRFKLDVSQLPRPFQIGVVGQTEWTVAASRWVRVGVPAP